MVGRGGLGCFGVGDCGSGLTQLALYISYQVPDRDDQDHQDYQDDAEAPRPVVSVVARSGPRPARSASRRSDHAAAAAVSSKPPYRAEPTVTRDCVAQPDPVTEPGEAGQPGH